MNARTLGMSLLVAALVAGCSGTGVTPSSPAASSAAPAVSTGPASAVASASATASAPAPTPSAVASNGGDSGSCGFMSDADALTLLSSAGQAHKIFADTAAGSVTSCRWGAALGQQNRVILLVDQLKIAPAIDAAKASIGTMITEKIAGLGDNGGFALKDPASVEVAFIKGSTTVLLTVNVAGVDPNAVAAIAMKIAATL